MNVKPSFILRVDVIFALALLVFVLLLVLTYNSAREVTVSRKWEDHTQLVMRKLELLLSHALDLETGSRGYTLTGNKKFLTPMEISEASMGTTLDSLKALVSGNEIQRRRIDTLESLLIQKKEFSKHSVDLRNSEGIAPAIAYVSDGQGKQIMDSIRSVIARATSMEVELLRQHATSTDDKRAQRTGYFVVLVVLALILIVAAYMFTRRNMVHLLLTKNIQEDLINELSYQNQQLDDFAHITSHNIRGPASNISTLVSMIEDESTIDDYQLIFGKLKKVSNNLGETLNELIDVLQVKKNSGIEKKTLRFEDILVKEKENLEGEIMKTNASITHDFSAAPTVVYPNAYLESIFHNLLSNALKYRSPDRDPEIHVSSENKEGHLYLHVRDNGLGIDLNRYGDKLFGLRKTFHEHQEARGIGLFMTKAQIETLGGRITVQSHVGKGTTFTVRF